MSSTKALLQPENKIISHLVHKSSINSFSCTVYGESMNPVIPNGTKVTFEKIIPSQIVCGDIVLFQKNNKYLVHRVLWKRKTNIKIEFYIKGDCSWFADKWISEENIFAVVQRIDRKKNRFLRFIPKQFIIPYSFSFLIFRRILRFRLI